MSREMFRRVALSQAAPLALAASGVPLTAPETVDLRVFDDAGRVTTRKKALNRGR